MTDRSGKRTTFGIILADVAATNSGRLMARATIANRLAKTLKGRARTRAYGVKHSALLRLSTRFAKDVTVRSDPQVPGFVIVTVQNACFGLHAPGRVFSVR